MDWVRDKNALATLIELGGIRPGDEVLCSKCSPSFPHRITHVASSTCYVVDVDPDGSTRPPMTPDMIVGWRRP